MRLTSHQAETIRRAVCDAFGRDARVYLFGSRVDDTARGGDVDLFVETDQRLPNRAAASARLAGELQLILGDQHIDIVLADAETPHQRLFETARARGIQL
jgi:predicted nucleotidyltransferase